MFSQWVSRIAIMLGNMKAVCQAGAEVIREEWLSNSLDSKDSGEWIHYLVQLAEQILKIYGKDCAYLDYDLLQAEAIREQEYFAFVDEMHHRLLLKTVRPLYRQLHPSRNLETIPGVDWAAMGRVFNLRNVLELVDNPLNDGSLTQEQLVNQRDHLRRGMS